MGHGNAAVVLTFNGRPLWEPHFAFRTAVPDKYPATQQQDLAHTDQQQSSGSTGQTVLKSLDGEGFRSVRHLRKKKAKRVDDRGQIVVSSAELNKT
jgi:hypothetical protein